MAINKHTFFHKVSEIFAFNTWRRYKYTSRQTTTKCNSKENPTNFIAHDNVALFSAGNIYCLCKFFAYLWNQCSNPEDKRRANRFVCIVLHNLLRLSKYFPLWICFICSRHELNLNLQCFVCAFFEVPENCASDRKSAFVVVWKHRIR